jgi:parvulin-like peptidyl-prolyl isomerase
MQQQSVYKLINTLLFTAVLSLAGCSDEEPAVTSQTAVPAERASKMSAEEVAALGDVIARVGDQDISFTMINTMLNSSAVVGVSVPALGTPERDTARIVVLDKVVSANLLYLDALRQGLDKDPVYQQAMQAFTDGMLGSQYQQKIVAGTITVSEAEIQEFFDKNIVPGTEMTDDLHTQIKASLHKRKLQQRLAAQREELHQGHKVLVYPDRLAPGEDDAQADAAVVASIDDQAITWGEVKGVLIAAGKGATYLDALAMESDAQLEALQNEIDSRIIAGKARDAGLEKDALYQSRLKEFQKTRLVNLHRANLARQMEPSDEQLKEYYEANRMSIMQVEMRKLQEALLETREQAEMLKGKVEAGELTMFQVAADHSIAPGAKQSLGEVGWIAKGRAQPALDKVIFELEPGEIGGPVESTEGWHLFKVLDVADEKFGSLKENETRKLARRRYIHDKLNEYVADLRKNDFTVEVYEQNLVRLGQKEVDMIARLTEEASKPGSKTEQRIEELNKLIGE